MQVGSSGQRKRIVGQTPGLRVQAGLVRGQGEWRRTEAKAVAGESSSPAKAIQEHEGTLLVLQRLGNEPVRLLRRQAHAEA